MVIRIMQGDACRLAFQIRQNGTIVTPEMITDLEVTVGNLRKTYLDGGITFESECWYTYLSQEDTKSLSGSEYIRLRIRYLDQPWVAVRGTRMAQLNVDANPRAEVL